MSLEDGFRESELSWTQLLLNLKRKGMAKGSKLAVENGSLGFWKAALGKRRTGQYLVTTMLGS